MNIPDKNTDPSGAIKFLQTLRPELSTEKAQQILDRGTQYESYVSDFNRTISTTIRNLEDFGRGANGQNVQGRMATDSEFSSQANKVKKYLDSFSDYIDENTKTSFNNAISSASQRRPQLNVAQYQYTTGASRMDSSSGDQSTQPPKYSDYGSLKEYQAALANWKANKSSVANTATGSTNATIGTTTSNDQAAIDYINGLDLPADVKAIYVQALQAWDPNSGTDPAAIIQAFNKVKSETIDPRFQGLANLAISQIQTAQTNMQKQRDIELEAEQANKTAEVQSAQAGLEASGLTFSGKGVEQLGTQGAAVTPFGGVNVEGLVPKKHRLISTSSEAAYQQNLKNLGLSAENQLGSGRVSGLISGYTPVGSVVGSLEEEKQGAYGTSLGNLINQSTANAAQNLPLPTTTSSSS